MVVSALPQFYAPYAVARPFAYNGKPFKDNFESTRMKIKISKLFVAATPGVNPQDTAEINAISMDLLEKLLNKADSLLATLPNPQPLPVQG